MTIEINGREIGPGKPCYIIAECGVNHNGRIDLAIALVDAAKRAGADAAKFQVWNTARLLAPDSPQYRALLPLELSEGQLRHIKRHCDEVGITFLATPDQTADADMLESIGVPAYKIGSGHVRDIPLLRHVAAKGKPVILSTGMSTLLDVQDAVDAITLDGGNRQLALLHCVSAYPTETDVKMGWAWWHLGDVNLRAMDTLWERLGGYPVGFSDHSPIAAIALAAAARGACIIERHLMLNETRGPDRYVSLGADQFGVMVRDIRQIEAALGDGVKRPMESEDATMQAVAEWRRG